MTKHNKKRNVGLVYEMLVSYVSDLVIDDRQNEAKKAIKIIEKRFDKSTELYKEFRLFKALAYVTVDETHVAAGIIHEAKLAARRCDIKKLNREKSLLIRDINYQLSESNFFHKRVNNYKIYATIQTLLNEWRKLDKSNFNKVIDYEKVIITRLLEKDKIVENIENIDSKIKSDLLIFTVLSEKMNKKYNETLTSEQKDIVRNYAIYDNDEESLHIFLERIKKKTLSELNEFKKSTQNNVLLEKIDKVYFSIEELKTRLIDDNVIKKYLTVSSLKEQLLRSEND